MKSLSVLVGVVFVCECGTFRRRNCSCYLRFNASLAVSCYQYKTLHVLQKASIMNADEHIKKTKHGITPTSTHMSDTPAQIHCSQSELVHGA